MKFCFESDEAAAVQAVGGKGHHLQKLVRWKANVAPFFVIGTDAYEEFSRKKSIPSAVKERMEAFLKNHPTIALRSSMIGEDHLDASFAGLFETLLGTTVENWEENLLKIYSSMTSPRVSEYIQQKNIKTELKMAVVVQEEITVEKSGVLFSRSPVLPTSAIAVDAAFGMGEGVVSGHADVDHYLFTRLKEKIQGPSDGVLSQDEIDVLINESIRLEKEFESPSDIEWGYRGKELFIFQIRGITRKFSPLKVFADTNLSESYPGTVSPFTASFVRRAYENVFIESAEILGAKGKRLKLLKEHYRYLISCVDDHLYYNIEHYYAVLRALPGGEKNIENWHKMIGGKIEGIDIPVHDTYLSKKETFFAIFKLLSFARSKNKTYSNFLRDLEELSKRMQEDVQNLNASSKTIDYLSNLVERPLGFGLTVVNDVYIMIGLGLLGSAIKKRNLPEETIIDWLKTSQGLDSVKPLEAFNDLVERLPESFISDLQNMKVAAGFHPYEAIFESMLNKGWKEEVELLRNFLTAYGDRSFEELKLESLPLKNDPGLLMDLIKWGKHNKSSLKITAKPVSQVALGWFHEKVLNFTRDCITLRETTRLWRGRFYHILRQLILKLAEQLMSEDPRWKEFGLRDFFSLDYREWKLFKEGKLNFEEARNVILERRLWQKKQHNYPEFVIWAEDERFPEMNSSLTFASSLKGQGVSPGIIEAQALVLENPTEALNVEMDDFILVTKNTDPAWIYIMSRSKGLISEKGSMLSHTAIIGRELGVPTLVGVKSATHLIKTGDRLRIDGTSGEITIL